jgi:putative tryptophan/tyrosine transport system substrate-binding protein
MRAGSTPPLRRLKRRSRSHFWSLRPDFVAKQRLPAMYGFKEFCSKGGLMSYGTSLLASFRRYGYFIDKILKGTKAGDIPVEEPSTFQLVVNARAAKDLGLTLPQSILIRADEVIE